MTGTTPRGAASEQEAARWVRGMFGRIAGRYDLLNHLLSLQPRPPLASPHGESRKRNSGEARRARAGLCCGTGDVLFSIEARQECKAFGSDFCHPMLVEAKRKVASPLFESDALNLPLRNESLDLITIAFGFRNLANYRSGPGRIPASAEAGRNSRDPRILAAHQSRPSRPCTASSPPACSQDRRPDLRVERRVLVSPRIDPQIPDRRAARPRNAQRPDSEAWNSSE